MPLPVIACALDINKKRQVASYMLAEVTSVQIFFRQASDLPL